MRRHWTEYGRNFYCRYDYEGVDKDKATAVMTHLVNSFPSLPGRKLCGGKYEVSIVTESIIVMSLTLPSRMDRSRRRMNSSTWILSTAPSRHIRVFACCWWADLVLFSGSLALRVVAPPSGSTSRSMRMTLPIFSCQWPKHLATWLKSR